MSNFVFAMYSSHAYAQRAVQVLLDEHVPPADLGLFPGRGQADGPVRISYETRVSAGAVAGSVVGGLVAASLISFRFLSVDVSSTLESAQLAAIATLTGLAFGALRGLGRWEQRAVPVTGGAVGVGVRVDVSSWGYITRIRAILEQTGGRNVELRKWPGDIHALCGHSPVQGPQIEASVSPAE